MLAEDAEAFLRAAVVSSRGYVDVGQVSKLAGGRGGIVVNVGFTPTVRGTGGVRGGGFGREEAIQLVVGELL